MNELILAEISSTTNIERLYDLLEQYDIPKNKGIFLLPLALRFSDLGLYRIAMRLRRKYETMVLSQKGHLAIIPEEDAESMLMRVKIILDEIPPRWSDAEILLKQLLKKGNRTREIISLYSRVLHYLNKIPEAIKILEENIQVSTDYKSQTSYLSLLHGASTSSHRTEIPADMQNQRRYLAAVTAGLNNPYQVDRSLDLLKHASSLTKIDPELRATIRFRILYRFYLDRNDIKTAMNYLISAIKVPGISADTLADISWEVCDQAIRQTIDWSDFSVKSYERLNSIQKNNLNFVVKAMEEISTYLHIWYQKEQISAEILFPFFSRLMNIYKSQGAILKLQEAETFVSELTHTREKHLPNLQWLAEHWFPLEEIKALPNYTILMEEANKLLSFECGMEQPRHDNRRVAILSYALLDKLTIVQFDEFQQIYKNSQSHSDRMYLIDYAKLVGREDVLNNFLFQHLENQSYWDCFVSYFGVKGQSLFNGKLTIDNLKKARENAIERIRLNSLDAASMRVLSAVESTLGYDHEAKKWAENAKMIEDRNVIPGNYSRVGQIWAAASYKLLDGSGIRKGIIHEMSVRQAQNKDRRKFGLYDDQIKGLVQPDFLETAKDAFVAADRFAQMTPWCKNLVATDDYRSKSFELIIPLDEYPSGGKSAGITMTVLFLSSFLNKPIPQDVALTGEIRIKNDKVEVKVIADEAYKARGMREKGLSYLILPKDNEIYLPLDYDFAKERLRFVSSLDEIFMLKRDDGSYIFDWGQKNG